MKNKIILLATLTIFLLAIFFRKEVIFLLGSFDLVQAKEGKDFCIKEDSTLSLYIYSSCEELEEYKNLFFIHGWSPRGNNHEDLRKIAGLFILANKNVRIFFPKIKSLTSPTWKFEQTTIELLVINQIVSQYNVTKYRIFSICGSTQGLINIIGNNLLELKPDMLFLYKPYFSIHSLMEAYNGINPKFEGDIYVKSLLLYNLENSLSKDLKVLIKKLFYKSNPGKTDLKLAKEILGGAYQKVKDYQVKDNTIESLKKYEPSLPDHSGIQFLIINSANDSSIPYTESLKLHSELVEKGNEAEIFITGSKANFVEEILQGFRMLSKLAQ